MDEDEWFYDMGFEEALDDDRLEDDDLFYDY